MEISLTEKELDLLRFWEEYELSTNEEYVSCVEKTIGVLLELTNSLHQDDIKLPSWKIWAEPIIYKFCYHVSSLVQLFKGTELPFEHEGKKTIIFDEPSMFILFRACLENYLTFFYLFIEDIDEAEKEFRMLVWRYSSLKQRIGFKINTEEARKKQEKECILVDSLSGEIVTNKYFRQIPKKQQEKVLSGKNPRLFTTWNALMVRSDLKTSLYENIYGYKSNYSHSEFLSVLQVHEGSYGHSRESTRSHHSLLLIHGLVGKMITETTIFFPSMNKHFQKKDDQTKNNVQFLNTLSRN